MCPGGVRSMHRQCPRGLNIAGVCPRGWGIDMEAS